MLVVDDDEVFEEKKRLALHQLQFKVSIALYILITCVGQHICTASTVHTIMALILHAGMLAWSTHF